MALDFVPIFESLRAHNEGAVLIEVMDDKRGKVAGYVLAVLPPYYPTALDLCQTINGEVAKRLTSLDPSLANPGGWKAVPNLGNGEAE